MEYETLTNNVPQVPSNLYLTNPDDIKQLDTMASIRRPTDPVPSWESGTVYTMYQAPDELVSWVQTHFDFPVKVTYQLITGQVPIHKDVGRTKCWNYIIDAGGDDVVTRWWNDDKTKVIRAFVFPTDCWYELNVGINHDVANVTGTRIAITVWVDVDKRKRLFRDHYLHNSGSHFLT